MYEVDASMILRCVQCNKPFDKESTLKRHGYYCRSRRAGFTTRTHSCISCAKAKARCDHKQPGCSRCLNIATKCQYPINTSRGKTRRRQHTEAKHVQQPQKLFTPAISHLTESHFPATGFDGDYLLDDTLDVSQSMFTGLEQEFFDPDLGLSGAVEQFSYSTDSHDYPKKTSSNCSANSSDATAGPREGFWTSGMLMQATPSNSVRSFNERPKLSTSAIRISTLIFHNLRSYPLMVRRDGTLPPFLHVQLTSSGSENLDMEPMSNCISLLQMLYKRTPSTQKLFWKNVQMECERLHAEHLTLSKWQLLTGMQALSLYLLVRLAEGQTDYNNVDSLLALATRFNSSISSAYYTRSSQDTQNDHNLQAKWKEWVFEESARRLCIIYQIVNMLVYFEPAAMCDLDQPGLLLAPLPTKKGLWQANNEILWRTERDRHPEALRTFFGLGTSGDLVRLDDGYTTYRGSGASLLPHSDLYDTNSNCKKASWEEWCADMDDLGGLVMLAAALIT